MNSLIRVVAGCFAGAGALLLIYEGHYEPAIAILSTMVGFFVGEANGQKKAAQST
jgi:hypothetical protein